ncbi:MAG TPA: protein kinase [Thermoanaerobaculia bacterium]|nr:protein kinase [Thermoanaerobaculia bacterium]
MHLFQGSLVGPYRILAPIGAGGMGEVYRARDDRLNRDIALKILSSELASSAEHLRRFQQEAHAASALNHPNIITIYDIGMAGDVAYIAMELVDGQDLRSLYAGERLPLKTMLRIAVKAADGLAAAHERGIVHRDLKPENVMISRDGFVKILDFGLAKLVRPITETQSTAPHTTPGAVFGTVAYMSPEQASGKPIDFRSDQFSLGVILYELLTGRMPFSEATAAETLAAIIRVDAPLPSTVNDAVPPELDRLLARCLAKDPAERYASTRDLARDLREIRDRISNSSEPRYGSDRPPVAPARRMAWASGAAVGLVLLAIGAVMALRDRSAAVRHGPQSVAVLPFRDLSGTADGQIFADGISEMVRSRLGESRTLHVIPAFDRDPKGDPTTVARGVGAAYAVSGNVQRVGNEVHLSVSLIDAQNGEQVTGRTIEGSMNDVFALHRRAVDVILTGMHATSDAPQRAAVADLVSAADQNAYVQALGLLQNANDEQSVDRAITTLEGLLRNARDSAAVNAQLARALYDKSYLSRRPGLIEQATVYAERAAELDDSQADTHVWLGQIRFASGRHADALREYQRAIALQGDNAEAFMGLAITHQAIGRAADAEANYKRAISMRRDSANFYNLYAAFLFNSGRFEEAATNFRRVTELQPRSARGYSNLGGADQALGNYDAARKAYETAIAMGPYPDVYVNLGVLEYYVGNYEKAEAALRRAVALAPTHYVAWVALGDTYRWAPGKRAQANAAYEQAVAAARQAIAVNAKDAVAEATEANALAKVGRVREASVEIEHALKIDPTDATVLYSAGVVALLRGNADVAVGWLQRAVNAGYPFPDLQHDPEFRSAHGDPAFPKQPTKKT